MLYGPLPAAANPEAKHSTSCALYIASNSQIRTNLTVDVDTELTDPSERNGPPCLALVSACAAHHSRTRRCVRGPIRVESKVTGAQ